MTNSCKCTSGSWTAWQLFGNDRMVRYLKCRHGVILNTEYKNV